MSYIDQLNEKRLTTAQTNKEQSELASMLAELKKMQMAALMGSQGKSTVILTDQTDLGDKIKELTDKLVSAVESTDTKELNSGQLTAIKELKTGLADLQSAFTDNYTSSKQQTADIIAAIKSLKLDPTINLPESKVTVQGPKIDFSPLQKTIKEAMQSVIVNNAETDQRIDLSRYRAVDLKDGQDIQYVGFLNPEGDWYIIENKVRENSMRFVFGSGAYATHFRKCASYVYKPLDKAVNAAA